MAPHSSTLAWKIPWTAEPGRLQSMGSLGVGQDWTTSLSLFTFMHWRRKWQPNPVFLPGESQGWRSLVGCCLWGRRVRHDWSDLAAAAILPWFSTKLPFLLSEMCFSYLSSAADLSSCFFGEKKKDLRWKYLPSYHQIYFIGIYMCVY